MNKQEIKKRLNSDEDRCKYCNYSTISAGDIYCNQGFSQGMNCEGEDFAVDFNIGVITSSHQLTTGWIPVSERLPERRRHKSGEPIEFNIMLLGGRVPTTGCINDYGIWGQMDWERYIFNPIGIKVLYWRPLPEPPKEVN